MKIIYKDGTVAECPPEEELHVLRHSAAHIMAQAIKRLFPEADFAFGPATQNGFYYDVDLGDRKLTQEDLDAIEKEMKKITKENLPFKAFILNREDSKKLMTERGEKYKLEHMEDLADENEFSFFQQGEYVDMCLGPHLLYTKALKAFKITQQSGAYWKDDKDNKMLTRINGVAFRSTEELDAYMKQLEEAKKRDHRKLGKELGLYAFRDEAPGFPFYLPKGMVLRNTLIDYWRKVHKKWDYVEISTPQIMRRTLWETSGHWDHYKDNMYTTVIDGEDFAIKPMNCPGSILVYDLEPHSYKELPLRYAELGIVHRHELSGALHGMFRVRCFTQDDAHILLAKDQIKDEVIRIAQLFDEVYSVFGLPYTIELSTMPEDHIGSVEDWDIATAALADAITSIGKEYILNPGDGAFYGPKLDFHIQDCLGRTWQCGTIQLDYQLPGRFDLSYVTSDGGEDCPVMIHRVVFGSIERFIGIITEHYAGAFPTWLAPVQVKVLPITDRAAEYSKKLSLLLEAEGIRTEVDYRNEKIGYKIRSAQMEKVPYMLVIGDKEVETHTVAVRTREGKDLGAMEMDAFLEKIETEVLTKK
ncbi:MAG: threonine--tRNA ligase [Oscillospiraceae bacterium]|nr:threonine--tRNA ligase [Oscillospiraceae bacterium]